MNRGRKVSNKMSVSLLGVAIILSAFLFSFVSAYDSGWQDLRTKNDYYVCGGDYPACTLSGLGVDSYFSVPTNDARYGMICGELEGKDRADCLLWGGAWVGRHVDVPLNDDYYLIIKAVYGRSEDVREYLRTGLSGSSRWDEGAVFVADLGSGDKTCVVRDPYTLNPGQNKFFIQATEESINPYSYRISNCIPNEDLVYCDNGAPTVTNCLTECVPNIVLGDWHDWVDFDCAAEGYREQGKSRVEYDANNCGVFQNFTQWEYKLIEDEECRENDEEDGTFVMGTIYEPDSDIPVGEAEVLIECNGLEISTESLMNGDYVVELDRLLCPVESIVTALAKKGNLIGSNSGVVEDFSLPLQMNIAVVNIWLLPIDPTLAPTITIHSPMGNYLTENVTLNATSNQRIINWTYNLNNLGNVSVNNAGSFNLTSILTNLQNGSQRLVVCGTNSNGIGCDSVEFNVSLFDNEDENQIEIIVHSPINNSIYKTSTVLLNASANVTANIWTYSLNGEVKMISLVPSDKFISSMTGLTTGNYSLLVCGLLNESVEDCETVLFQIILDDDNDNDGGSGGRTKKGCSTEARVSVISLEEKNYTDNETISLNVISSDDTAESEFNWDNLGFFIIVGILVVLAALVVVLFIKSFD